MTPTRLEFVFAAAFSLGFTAHGANAAYLNSAAGAPKQRAAEFEPHAEDPAIILVSVAR